MMPAVASMQTATVCAKMTIVSHSMLATDTLTNKMCVKDTLQLTHRQTNCGKDTQKRKALSEEVIIGSWEGGLSNNNYTRGSAVNMWLQDCLGWKFQPSSNNLSLDSKARFNRNKQCLNLVE